MSAVDEFQSGSITRGHWKKQIPSLFGFGGSQGNRSGSTVYMGQTIADDVKQSGNNDNCCLTKLLRCAKVPIGYI